MARIGDNTRFAVVNSSATGIIWENWENFHDIIRVALAFFFVLRYNWVVEFWRCLFTGVNPFLGL